MTTELLALADRVEAAAEADRALDCAIADAVSAWPAGWVKHLPGMRAPFAYHNPNGGAEWMEAPAYTASLDDAMTLVPEAWPSVEIRRLDDGRAYAGVAANDMHLACEDPDEFWAGCEDAATPALALTAAALRAHASRVGDRRGENGIAISDGEARG